MANLLFQKVRDGAVMNFDISAHKSKEVRGKQINSAKKMTLLYALKKQ